VFQLEPVSRPEAECEIQAISKALKMLGLRRAFFGTRPAFNNPGSGIKDRGIREGSRRAANPDVKLRSFSSQPKRKFGIQGDRGGRRAAQ
jgi:hypothetical protein